MWRWTGFTCLQGVVWAVLTCASPVFAMDAQEALGLLRAGRALIASGQPQQAIVYFDRVIPASEAEFQRFSGTVYCSHSVSETLLNSLTGLSEGKDSVVLDGVWCDAFFLKGFALIDLRDYPGAERNIRMAIRHSPANSQYWSELGHIQQSQRQWAAAIATFRKTEGLAAASTGQAEMKTRACRGIGYSLVELKKLDEAEANYKRCLLEAPSDEKSQHELLYIRQLRGQ